MEKNDSYNHLELILQPIRYQYNTTQETPIHSYS